MTAQEFVFNLPLYTRVSISENSIIDGLDYNEHMDGYNPIKDADSTYCVEIGIDDRYGGKKNITEVRLKCQRYGNYLSVFVYYDYDNNFIEKVGQYPSLADIHIAQVKQYKKVLGEPYIKDFTRAIGLAANGIGTGSFVYLRRVFEQLVTEIASDVIKSGEIDKTVFESSTMDKKLSLLSSHLPKMVNDNKSLYSVLSAGIHSLSEETCLEYFPIVKTIIELILDEKEHERLLLEKKKTVKDQLGTIVGEVRNTVRK